MSRKYDIVVYGFTGFTGKLCVEYLCKHHPRVNFAVAGRQHQKMQQQLLDMQIDRDILVADCHDLEALRKMVAQSTVVLTTVGPYSRYGSDLVEACVIEKTHYIDITGEEIHSVNIKAFMSGILSFCVCVWGQSATFPMK